MLLQSDNTAQNGDKDYSYNIEHILKEKLECTGQLPDVLDVVEEVA